MAVETEGARWVAVASFAAEPRAQVEVLGGALKAARPQNVWQAVAGSSLAVTGGFHTAHRALVIAAAFLAGLQARIAPEAVNALWHA